jgi:diguanylate cyclase (GGDEF)-like protein
MVRKPSGVITPTALLVNYSISEKRDLIHFLSVNGFYCLPPKASLAGLSLLTPFKKRQDDKTRVDLVLIDLTRHAKGEGEDIRDNIKKVHLFLRQIREMNATTCVILTGNPVPLEKASELLREGVYDYVTTPISTKRLQKAITQGLKNREQAEAMIHSLEGANRQLLVEKDHLKAWSEQLSLIYEINQTLAGYLNVDELICSFGEGIKKLTPYDTLVIFLKRYDESDRVWVWAFPKQKQMAEKKALLKGLREETMRWGNQFLFAHQSDSEAIIQRDGTEIIVPFSVAGKNVGVLRMTREIGRNGPIPFDEDQARLLSMVITPLCLSLRNADMYQRVNALASTDELTHVLNRRAFIHLLDREFKRFMRLRTPLALLLIDLDAFKQVNDRHGHLVGDVVLKETASLLKQSIREIDLLARYGGEEFVVVLPEGKPEQASLVAERIKGIVETHIFNKQKSPIRLTVSIGMALLPSSRAASAEDLFHLADLALYCAKKRGRNRIEVGIADIDNPSPEHQS